MEAEVEGFGGSLLSFLTRLGNQAQPAEDIGRIYGRTCGFAVLFFDGLTDFRTVDGHASWRLDAEAYRIIAHIDNGHDDIVTDEDFFADTAAEN